MKAVIYTWLAIVIGLLVSAATFAQVEPFGVCRTETGCHNSPVVEKEVLIAEWQCGEETEVRVLEELLEQEGEITVNREQLVAIFEVWVQRFTEADTGQILNYNNVRYPQESADHFIELAEQTAEE